LLGYADNDPHSVLFIDADKQHWRGGGKLHHSLGALIKKVIHPLSKRLLDDFPIYKEGKLYIRNIKELAKLYSCDDVWESHRRELESAFRGRTRNGCNVIKKKKINDLYTWVLRKQDDTAIPWEPDDLSYILGRI